VRTTLWGNLAAFVVVALSMLAGLVALMDLVAFVAFVLSMLSGLVGGS
jgi:hypothetical protein